MKHILFTMCILMLCACGGGSDAASTDNTNAENNTDIFTLQNVRFDSIDYYEGEQVIATEGTSFEVQWVSPISGAYRIDLYLSTNGQAYSDTNKIVGLKCGTASLSLCPNATGEVQCGIDNNRLTCLVGSESVGSRNFQDNDLSNLTFIIRGCDALSHCDVKTFDLTVQNNAENSNNSKSIDN